MKVLTLPAWSSPSLAAWRRSNRESCGGLSSTASRGTTLLKLLVLTQDRRNRMNYAIVGFGKIGQALAHAFARKDMDVTVASRRPPAELGTAGSCDWPEGRCPVAGGSAQGGYDLSGVPFGEHRDVAKVLPSWGGKTIIDAMNSFPLPLEELDGLPSSAFAAKSFAGAKFGKGSITWVRPSWRPIRGRGRIPGGVFVERR